MPHLHPPSTHPPLGIDPESHLLQRERVEHVLGALREHRFGAAFLAGALDERPWLELAAELGVEPNTLSKAWMRLVRHLHGAVEGGRDVESRR